MTHAFLGSLSAIAVVLAALIIRGCKFKNFVKILEFAASIGAVVFLVIWPLLNKESTPTSNFLLALGISLVAGLVSILLIVTRASLDN